MKGLYSVLKNTDRSWKALEDNTETSAYPDTVQPTPVTQLTVGQDSLLLSLLQLMVSALLALQQHPSVFQVPGEVVALPLQLVSRLLGLFIHALQLPKLGKEEREVRWCSPCPRSAPGKEKDAGREDLRGVPVSFRKPLP